MGRGRPSVSLEVFPPKAGADIAGIYRTLDRLSGLQPDFISVTYGAAGTQSKNTIEIADYIQKNLHLPALAHLTCLSSTKEQIAGVIGRMQACGIENVLALRGDIPEGFTDFPTPLHFHHASDLIGALRAQGEFCIAGACYPEGHPDSANAWEDLVHLKHKVEAGCEFLISQLFFDNSCFFSFLDKLRAMDVKVPVLAGIMPITAKSHIQKMCILSGAKMPDRLTRMLARYQDSPEALREAGIAYATEQIVDLLSAGVDGVHIYTMNKSKVCTKILENIASIRKEACR